MVALALSVTGFAQIRLAEKAYVSVITFGAGQEELYTAFGHSGIRVCDSTQGFDIFFNYGVFDFNQPHFYLNFARGYLNYMVDGYDYSAYEQHYIQRGRFVHEQVLNLTGAQKQKVLDYLVWNTQPANKYYPYDYFYNNCATKVRDAMEAALGPEIAFDSTYIKTNYTIRNLTDLYLGQQPWGDLGIDICLGLPMDKKASPYEYMFLPDYIESSFDHATNLTTAQPLVKQKIIVFEPDPAAAPFHWFHPWIVFGILFAVASMITWKDWKEKRLTRWFDVPLFLTVGLIGVLLFFLWTLTDHRAAANNFNLLWALPTHAVAAIFLLKKERPAWLQKYFLIVTILTALLLGSWYLLPQMLNRFLIPVVGVILMRALVNMRVST